MEGELRRLSRRLAVLEQASHDGLLSSSSCRVRALYNARNAAHGRDLRNGTCSFVSKSISKLQDCGGVVRDDFYDKVTKQYSPAVVVPLGCHTFAAQYEVVPFDKS